MLMQTESLEADVGHTKADKDSSAVNCFHVISWTRTQLIISLDDLTAQEHMCRKFPRQVPQA